VEQAGRASVSCRFRGNVRQQGRITMTKFRLALLAGGVLLGLSAPAFAFQCPADMAKIDEALQTAELSEEQKQRVQELRDEGERLHEEGQHQESVDTLAQAKEILGIE
jgi:hypothetical protein